MFSLVGKATSQIKVYVAKKWASVRMQDFNGLGQNMRNLGTIGKQKHQAQKRE